MTDATQQSGLSRQHRRTLRSFGFKLEGDRYVALVPQDHRASQSPIARGAAPVVSIMQHFETTGEIDTPDWKYDTRSHTLSVSGMNAAELQIIPS